jgi:two-component system, OmpR family, sensor histidine kinase AdeS
MSDKPSLHSRLVRAVTLVTILALVVMLVGMSGFYMLAAWLAPGYFPPDELRPPLMPELVAMGVFAGISLTMAIVIGHALSRRIDRPLEAVAAAARAVSRGDLTARVAGPGKAFGEIAQLITDFNIMASQLQRAESEMRWQASAIAHELRTPLTVLRGRLQGLSDGVFQAGPTEFKGLIRQVEALARIVDDLRTLSLATAERMELHLERVDLIDEVQAVLAAFEPDLVAAGLEVERDLAQVHVDADGARLRQALLALLDNARRYAASGRVVRIETRTTRETAVLRVADRGPGLPAGVEYRAFERFWRADDSRSRATGGTGLGLAVVRAIAEAHGGAVSARMRKGGGAEFTLLLPRRHYRADG